MAKKEHDSVKSKVIAGVMSGLILAALFYAVPKLLQWIVRVFTWLWHYFTSSITIPLWLLFLLMILSIATLVRLIAPLLRREHNNEQTFKLYTQDVFEGVTWRWSYDWYDRPADIMPYCPACDAVLVHINEPYHFGRASSVSFYCESCKQVRAEIIGGDRHYANSMIGRFIDRKIRNGEWKHLVRRELASQ